MVRHVHLWLKDVLAGGLETERGTFICAHAWIFFKLCILITHYIRTMEMYYRIRQIRVRLRKQTLTYSTFEVVHVSHFPCPKSIVVFISMVCHLD